MAVECGHPKGSGRRQTGTIRNLENEIMLNTSNRLEGKTRLLRASDILLSLAGRSTTNDTGEPSPAVENFQEALRLFPPFRDDDGATLGVLEVRCPDCDAVFSSSAELDQHYLTRYCPGAAVAVYVMMRDRLITKGYRMEKRLIPLDSRPIRFFCSSCERPFSLSHDETQADWTTGTACFVDCTHCGSSCNILYEPVLNDPRDDASCRDTNKEIASSNHSRSPSIMQKSSMTSKFSSTDYGEQSLAKKARKIRDSWSFRKISHGDEEELLAISFAGLYDLEKVHAPNGTYRPLDNTGEMNPPDASFCASASGLCDSAVMESEKTLCEDETRLQANGPDDSERGLVEDKGDAEYESPRDSKRQSFFQKIFGRKISTGLSRSRSTNKGKKLLKRANSIRFSLVTKSRGISRAAARDSLGSSEEALTREMGKNNRSTAVHDAEYISLLRGTQKIYVHVQYLSGGAIVHDASGRQRILQVDEIAKLFLQMKDELTSTASWSKVLMTRVKAEAFLKQGNLQEAVAEFHNVLKLLGDTPGFDVEKRTRAAVLHSLGQAYRDLDLPVQSEACYLESLGTYKRVHGRDHSKNFAVLHDLGKLCEKDGYATEAAAVYERSFAGRLKTLGHNAPDTLNSMQDLASLKVLLGDLESALLLLEKAVPALETVFGIQNATTLNAMNKLSQLYQKLGLERESRIICSRAIPHCRTVFGLNSLVTRDAVVRYVQSSDNFDFPPDIQDILDRYKRSRNPDCLRVIHRLGRCYMDVGLNRDAADLFEGLVEDFMAVKGSEAPETFDALSALCVSREHLDSVDKAILAYRQLVHMARRTPEHHHSRKRIGYAEKRIAELDRRRDILENEKREWGLGESGSCENCGGLTVLLCKTCNITRFCSDACRKQYGPTHRQQCIPSVSLRESKSLAIKPKCPDSVQDQALSKMAHYDSRLASQISLKTITITANYTLYLDPRNFTTIRMKLNPNVNTIVLFSLDSDVQHTALTINPPSSPTEQSQSSGGKFGRISLPTSSSKKNTPTPSSPSTPHAKEEITWRTPQTQDWLCHIPLSTPAATQTGQPAQSLEKYVLVKPGKEMHKSLVDKRVSVRAGPENAERDLFLSLDAPNRELIEYAQGLLLTGYLGEVVMYVVEWVWK
ncbi:hypothetical protein BJX61DRAFT_548625 [Aspergillus egyptiacus]|nr:hypothetical protein BJX61DRAFT_548625 [Aspergillus egyptiacus]